MSREPSSRRAESTESNRANYQLVAHTVAERRARAEALEIQRIRVCRAKLEASEAALEAARQRALSLRSARISELRSRDEERRAKVTARRKRLEEVKNKSFFEFYSVFSYQQERKEYLDRCISDNLTTPDPGGHPQHSRSFRHAPPKPSICGFASELDPSDPRYCPFGFGSSSRRDVCLSAKQQMIATRKIDKLGQNTLTRLFSSASFESGSKTALASRPVSSRSQSKPRGCSTSTLSIPKAKRTERLSQNDHSTTRDRGDANRETLLQFS